LAANGSGQLVTLEGSPEIARLAEQNLLRLGFAGFEIVSGRHQVRLAPTLHRLPPVDFAVIDAEHSEDGTLWALAELSRFAADSAVLFLDDIRWSPGMSRAWERILRSRVRVAAAVDLDEVGVLLLTRDHVGLPELLRVE
jgi:predicted O-methyltransferase YrrM